MVGQISEAQSLVDLICKSCTSSIFFSHRIWFFLQSLLYAKGSGDVFPIHTNPDFARMVGLPDVILHGMCTLAFSTRAVVSALLGGEAQRLRTLSVRFAKMVFHGDTLSTRIWRDDGGARFVTANQDGKLVLREGTASFD